MFKPLVRLLAFFGKEFNEVRRQPRLVLSLILGPFLILLLFGVGYTGRPDPLRIVMVVPESEMDNPNLQRVQDIIDDNFILVDTTPDEAFANRLLEERHIDVVEVFPPDMQEKMLTGEQIWIAFRYNEISPVDAQWLQYTGYVQVNALNQAILMQTAGEVQDEAAETNILLQVTGEQLDALSDDSSDQERAEARQSIGELQVVIALLLADPVAAQAVLGDDADVEDLQALQNDLNAVDQAIADGNIEAEQERIAEARSRVTRLEDLTRRLSTTSSQALVQPLQFEYQNAYGRSEENQQGQTLELVEFYAPGVLALILQHIAVTLGALSLVREKLLGALEMFSVAPTSMPQVLTGKILAYTLFIGMIAALLTGLMIFGLRVPFLGSPIIFAANMGLFILASIGVGLVLSTLSNSDTQAVQLSMIVLLVSIFFSGFFLPLEQFQDFATWIGYSLPVTHGMDSFVNMMLRGESPERLNWLGLAAIFVVSIIWVLIAWGRQFRRLT